MKLLPIGGLLLLFFCLGGMAHAQPSAAPAAQSPPPFEIDSAGENPFLGGIPSDRPTADPLQLTLREAIERGLRHNLGLLLSDQATRAARGARWRALSDLLPHIRGGVSETRQELSTAALGLTGLPGTPPVIGPFNVFDARLFLSQSIFDAHAIYSDRAESENLKAAERSYQEARDLVTLVVANLYLQIVAETSRIEAAQALVRTAEALYNQARDLKQAGIIAGIDLLRSQVELETQRQRLIFLENEFEKRKLGLARAIGLPTGQLFRLEDRIPYAPAPVVSFEESLARAYRSRSDFQKAAALARAAALSKKAVTGESLPSLRFNGDIGEIGPSIGDVRSTYLVRLELQIPIFEGGRYRGKMLEAEALLERRKMELEDLRGRIDYELRMVFLDLKASNDQARVAQSALDLANEQLKQAEDRFSAGVVSSIEVTQAQDSVAAANENYIASLYALNVAKASLARAMGIAEKGIVEFLGIK